MKYVYIVRLYDSRSGLRGVDTVHWTLPGAEARIREALQLKGGTVATDGTVANETDKDNRVWNKKGESYWECKDGSTYAVGAYAVSGEMPTT